MRHKLFDHYENNYCCCLRIGSNPLCHPLRKKRNMSTDKHLTLGTGHNPCLAVAKLGWHGWIRTSNLMINSHLHCHCATRQNKCGFLFDGYPHRARSRTFLPASSRCAAVFTLLLLPSSILFSTGHCYSCYC